MKPIIGVFLVAALLITLAACAPKIRVDSLEETEYTNLEDTGIVMSVADESVTTDTPSLTIEYTNQTDVEYVYGLEPHLEIQKEGIWYVIPLREDAAWNDIGLILPPDGTSEEDFSLEYFYEGLIPGHYRVIKTLYADGNGVTAAAEFDIAESNN